MFSRNTGSLILYLKPINIFSNFKQLNLIKLNNLVLDINVVMYPCIDLNIRDSCGNTPLHIAIEHNSLDAVEFLLQK